MFPYPWRTKQQQKKKSDNLLLMAMEDEIWQENGYLFSRRGFEFFLLFKFICLKIYPSIKIVFRMSGAVDIELYQCSEGWLSRQLVKSSF